MAIAPWFIPAIFPWSMPAMAPWSMPAILPPAIPPPIAPIMSDIDNHSTASSSGTAGLSPARTASVPRA